MYLVTKFKDVEIITWHIYENLEVFFAMKKKVSTKNKRRVMRDGYKTNENVIVPVFMFSHTFLCYLIIIIMKHILNKN